MKLLKNFIFWSYERGSIQYDVMVTLILAFIFVTPHFFDFGDGLNPDQANRVVIDSTSDNHLTYRVRAADVDNAMRNNDERSAAATILRPVAGDVTIDDVKLVKGWHGKHIQYIVQAHR